ncbi:uncharacterized protein JN550_010200 [Neoarthrinium moseri]|uniref:uncharacterized protein n=1 Tax=Neoarthrinium moseri TaxID=1658444 RepID=UPI001FDC2CF9|nr:uncharacterized protein JN550_010200 [Neoarthrinium moseri]KAI1862338.1 hypothetical protein JN550_010200 [Neoarthrinium moseri]
MLLSPGSSRRQERRREQIRVSQRNFRERQRNRIAALESQVNRLEAMIRAVEHLNDTKDSPTYGRALRSITRLVEGLEPSSMPSVVHPRYESMRSKVQQLKQPAPSTGQRFIGTSIHAALIDRFVDYMSPFRSVPQAKHHWVNDNQPRRAWRTGAGLMGSDFVHNAYLAAATRFTGQELDDPRLTHAADGLYSSVLGQLQKAIMDPITSKSDEVLVVTITCLLYEGRLRRTTPNAEAHVRGSLALFAHRGPVTCVAGVAHDVYVEGRMFWVWFSVMRRCSTILSEQAWKHIPWSLDVARKDMMDHLLDNIVDISTLLALIDESCAGNSNRGNSVLSARILTTLRDISQNLRAWKHSWMGPKHGNVSEKPVPAGFAPVFEYVNSNTGNLVRPTIFMFNDAVAFQASCHYYAALLIVSMVQRKLFVKDIAKRSGDLDFAILRLRNLSPEAIIEPGVLNGGPSHGCPMGTNGLRSRTTIPERLIKPWKLPPRKSYIFTHANVIDASTGKILPDTTVKISNGTIEAVCSADELPAVGDSETVMTINASGKYLSPGLIDAHVHLTAVPGSASLDGSMGDDATISHLRQPFVAGQSLRRGFTTLRDCGGATLALKEAIADSVFPGPRLFIANRALSQTGGHGDRRGTHDHTQPCCGGERAGLSMVCDGVPDCIRAAREQLRTGADFIKIMVGGGVASPTDKLSNTQFTSAEIQAIVEVAESYGTYVTAHAYTPRAIRHAISNGVRGIEHGNFIDEDTARLMKERGAWLTPTLVTYAAMADNKYAGFLPPGNAAKNVEVLEKGLESLRTATRAGVKICYGSDLLGPLTSEQLGEFKIRRRALSDAEILKAATVNPAEMIGQKDFLGQIREGYAADLLVMGANPLDDVSVFDQPEKNLLAVIKDGRVYDSRWSRLPVDVKDEVNFIE